MTKVDAEKQTDHSPLPWFASAVLKDAWNYDYVSVGPYDLVQPKEEYVEDEICCVSGLNHNAKANAEFIVKAVNTHEALVSALTLIRSRAGGALLTPHSGDGPLPEQDACFEIREWANAALQKASEGT